MLDNIVINKQKESEQLNLTNKIQGSNYFASSNASQALVTMSVSNLIDVMHSFAKATNRIPGRNAIFAAAGAMSKLKGKKQEKFEQELEFHMQLLELKHKVLDFKIQKLIDIRNKIEADQHGIIGLLNFLINLIESII